MDFHPTDDQSKKHADETHPHLNSVDILGGPPKRTQEPVRLPASKGQTDYIGTAVLKENETIVLHLKGRKDDLTGEGEVEYKLGDKLYNEVYQHLGGIRKGETKLVPSWADEPKNPAKQSMTDPGADKTGTDKSGADKDKPTDTSKTGTDTTADKSEQTSDQTKTGDQSKSTDQTKPGEQTKPTDQTKPVDQTATPTIPDVVLPPSAQFISTVNDTYSKMSPEVHDLLKREKTEVTPSRRLTDALPELKGQKPRGWPPGLTWDAVDGAYSPSRNLVVVAEETQDTSSNWVKSHRTEDVTRHEVGHATDYAMGKFSDTAKFNKAYDDDTKAIPPALAPTLKYFLQSGDGGKEEAFAEGLASREGGSTSGKVFDSGFALTIKSIDDELLVRRSKLPITPAITPGSGPVKSPAPDSGTGTGAGTPVKTIGPGQTL